MMKQLVGVALMLAPATAFAQSSARGPVTVEIVASGQVVVPAQRFRMSVKLSAKGDDNDAAAAALAASRAKLVQALGGSGIREAQPYEADATSIASLFASMGNPGKTTFTPDFSGLDEVADAAEADAVADSDTATPAVEKTQTIASQTVAFDAPSRAAVTGAKAAVEANGGELEDEVVAILNDYVAPTRAAKADALKKAQAEADAYAAALGMRNATLTKVSERQDIVAGSLGFISQLVGMFAPKGKTQSDNVSVQANLTAEFQLSR